MISKDKPSPWLDIVNLPLTIGAAILTAFVLSQLWLWFVVPLGLPAIGIAHAIGLTSVGFILSNGPHRAISQKIRDDKEPDAEAKKTTAYDRLVTAGATAIGALFMWGSGAIVRLFM